MLPGQTSASTRSSGRSSTRPSRGGLRGRKSRRGWVDGWTCSRRWSAADRGCGWARESGAHHGTARLWCAGVRSCAMRGVSACAAAKKREEDEGGACARAGEGGRRGWDGWGVRDSRQTAWEWGTRRSARVSVRVSWGERERTLGRRDVCGRLGECGRSESCRGCCCDECGAHGCG